MFQYSLWISYNTFSLLDSGQKYAIHIAYLLNNPLKTAYLNLHCPDQARQTLSLLQMTLQKLLVKTLSLSQLSVLS